MTFEQYLETSGEDVSNYLAEFFEGSYNDDLQRYLYKPLSEFTSNAGKRHRPAICMLACKTVGGNPIDALQSAAAVEHFHNAALIHDDIADQSQLRRGKPCMHLTLGTGLAINAGDMALTSVIASVVDDEHLSGEMKLRVINELIDMNKRTIEGQALDVGWAESNRFDITVEDYLNMATLKTAYYSGAVPLAIGATIGGGSQAQIDALREFGLLTGLAFQIQDDLLNLVGSKESTQKDFRNDITEGKRTYAAVHALCNSANRDELMQILSAKTSDSEQLERAVQIMQQAGSLDAARQHAQALVTQAKHVLEEQQWEEEPKQILLSMADYFVERLK